MSAGVALFGLGCLIMGVLLGMAAVALLSANNPDSKKAFDEGYKRGFRQAAKDAAECLRPPGDQKGGQEP